MCHADKSLLDTAFLWLWFLLLVSSFSPQSLVLCCRFWERKEKRESCWAHLINSFVNLESQEHLVPSSPSASPSPSSSSAAEDNSSDSASSSQEEEDPSSRGGIEGGAEEAEGLITQTTEVGDYELVDLHGQSATPPTVAHSPSTPDLLYHHRHSNSHHPLPTVPPDDDPDEFYDNRYSTHTSAAATLNRYSSSRDQQRRRNQNFLYNNNFHNQSFTAINGRHPILPHGNTNLNTFANGSILLNNAGYVPPTPINGVTNGTANTFLQQGKKTLQIIVFAIFFCIANPHCVKQNESYPDYSFFANIVTYTIVYRKSQTFHRAAISQKMNKKLPKTHLKESKCRFYKAILFF